MKSFTAEIPPVVKEMIIIKIDDDELINESFEYSIVNQDKKVCRKGQFTGNSVQLRITHLKDGKYFFFLTTASREPNKYPFEKKSKSYSDIVEFDFN
ncbi:MAG: hypothetical protein KIT80_20680 [Chitinophagaceae bacterium]|nr:hypothetical protein [Chitinophagaceae bacterium]MCW5929349.1 hypothetical protein [Chitinophagaceae bacterium]